MHQYESSWHLGVLQGTCRFPGRKSGPPAGELCWGSSWWLRAEVLPAPDGSEVKLGHESWRWGHGEQRPGGQLEPVGPASPFRGEPDPPAVRERRAQWVPTGVCAEATTEGGGGSLAALATWGPLRAMLFIEHLRSARHCAVGSCTSSSPARVS